MRFYVYYTYMFGRALWGSYATANEAFREAAKCRQHYQYVDIEEKP